MERKLLQFATFATFAQKKRKLKKLRRKLIYICVCRSCDFCFHLCVSRFARLPTEKFSKQQTTNSGKSINSCKRDERMQATPIELLAQHATNRSKAPQLGRCKFETYLKCNCQFGASLLATSKVCLLRKTCSKEARAKQHNSNPRIPRDKKWNKNVTKSSLKSNRERNANRESCSILSLHCLNLQPNKQSSGANLSLHRTNPQEAADKEAAEKRASNSVSRVFCWNFFAFVSRVASFAQELHDSQTVLRAKSATD